MATRQLPSALVDMLNQDPESPFHGLDPAGIHASRGRQATRRRHRHRPREAIRESLESPSGVLFPYRNIATGTTDTEGIRRVLLAYWGAVRDTFPRRMGTARRPESRLMHGVGIRAMGRLMDRVMAHVDATTTRRCAEQSRAGNWALIAPTADGPSGTWEELGLSRGTTCRTRRGTSARCRTTSSALPGRTDGTQMRFYFPDSQDLVSPTYDFLRDEYSPTRVRQRDDLYAHEVLDTRALRRHAGQQVDRRRLHQGRRQVLGRPARPHVPAGRTALLPPARRASRPSATTAPSTTSTRKSLPYTVDEVLDFYDGCGFDAGVSIDHIIFGYDPGATDADVDPAVGRAPTIYAAARRGVHRDAVASDEAAVQPVGAAQGWSPDSYADSVRGPPGRWATSASPWAAWSRSRPPDILDVPHAHR